MVFALFGEEFYGAGEPVARFKGALQTCVAHFGIQNIGLAGKLCGGMGVGI